MRSSAWRSVKDETMKKLALCVGTLAVLVPATVHAATIGTFAPVAPIPETLAQAFATTGIDGKIYILGGFTGGAGSAFTTARAYDPVADTYTTLAAMPTATRGACGGTLPDGRILVVAGYDSGQVEAIQLYNPVNNQWVAGPAAPGLHGWECAATMADDGNLHVFGGESGTTNYSIYDSVANTWSAGTAMPTSRRGHGAAFVDGKFYVYGGSDALTTLDVYDPVADTWTAGAALPATGATQFAFTSDGVSVFVFGGSTSIRRQHVEQQRWLAHLRLDMGVRSGRRRLERQRDHLGHRPARDPRGDRRG